MKITMIYFSPTHGTQNTVRKIGEILCKNLKGNLTDIDITHKENWGKEREFSEDEIVVMGLPVYAGRIPEFLEETIKGMKGNHTLTVLACVYGNRDYEDALLEMSALLKERGFEIAAAGAFLGEHSYTSNVAAGRPDNEDFKKITEFGNLVSDKIIRIMNGTECPELKIKGNFPYKERNPSAQDAPKTRECCTACMLCASECPVGAVLEEDPRVADPELCMKCCACIKVCPVDAKYFENERIASFTALLEDKFMERKEPEFFIT